MQIEEIKFIQWGMMTGEQWECFAVEHITKPSPKNQSSDPRQRIKTPNDLKLGEQALGKECGTCGKPNTECPGHFGYTKLPFPVYNKALVPHVVKILQSVCIHCYKTRITKDYIIAQGLDKYKGFERLKNLAEKCKSVRVCPHKKCGETMEYFCLAKKNEPHVIQYYVEAKKASKKEEFTASDAYNVLSKIKFKYAQLLGFNDNLSQNPEYSNPKYLLNETYTHAHQFKPESMIYTTFPILPTLARPFVQDGDDLKEDDITAKYNIILECICTYNKLNSGDLIDNSFFNLEKKCGDEEKIDQKSSLSTRRGYVKTKEDIGKEIMEHIWSLVNNKDEKSKIQNGNKPYRSLTCRLTGKDGRIQQNVGGKRTNFSARTVVIGGGTRLRDDQFGVPRDICETLTKKRTVLPANIVEYQKLVRDGKVNRIETKIPVIDRITNKIVSYKTKKISMENLSNKGRDYLLKFGDVIHRQLQDGDLCLVNRQPTLRPEGIQAFRTKMVEGHAFMLGLCFTSAYNCDFDGSNHFIS